jgi:hypothetical protein
MSRLQVLSMDRNRERRLLQFAVALACLVPLSAGLAGILQGPTIVANDLAPDFPDLESHFRYLSGLLFGIGMAFAAAIPSIERRSGMFAILCTIVVTGGLARLLGLLAHASPGPPHLIALALELVMVPLLFAWQRRVALRFHPGL